MEDREPLWQDPRWGNAAIACLNQICKLLDLNNVPTKETAEIVKMLAESALELERPVELMQ